jgi:endonuclease III
VMLLMHSNNSLTVKVFVLFLSPDSVFQKIHPLLVLFGRKTCSLARGASSSKRLKAPR